MERRPVIALAAGGTGGHVFPAEALATVLQRRGIIPLLFTDLRGIGFGGGVTICRVRGGGIAGMSTARRLRSLAALSFGFVDAVRHLKRMKPDVVVGFGGYASLPTLLAARLLAIPTVAHEQNAVLGRANRLLATRIDRIATAFAQVAMLPDTATAVRVGMPVRAGFASRRHHPYAPPQAGEAIRLLVLGGSQGAQVFSTLVPDAIGRLPGDLRARLVISQQCRPETLDITRDSYARLGISAELSPFFADVPERLAAAQLVIARAGASTVAELALVGRPALLIPYPYATDDHQTANAAALVEAGGGWWMAQSEISGEALAARLSALFANPAALAEAASRAHALGAPDAAEHLADLALSLIRVTGGRSASRPGRDSA